MTVEEAIAEVRSIAGVLAFRGSGVHPGKVSNSLKWRAKDLWLQAPFAPLFAKGRQYLTEPGKAVFNGKPATIQVINRHGEIHALIDDDAVEICNYILSYLWAINWEEMAGCISTPEFRDWTPEKAEAAIRKAAQALPELCDELEQAISPAGTNSVLIAQQAASTVIVTKKKVRQTLNVDLSTLKRMRCDGRLPVVREVNAQNLEITSEDWVRMQSDPDLFKKVRKK